MQAKASVVFEGHQFEGTLPHLTCMKRGSLLCRLCQ